MQKKFLVIFSLLAGGFVLANSAGSFTVPAVPLILNFVISVMILIVFFKPRLMSGLEIIIVLFFVMIAMSKLEFMGIFMTMQAFLNAGIATYKIIPSTEAG